MSPEQAVILNQILSIDGAVEAVEEVLVGYVVERIKADIEADPTVENPEFIYELLNRVDGYLTDLKANIAQGVRA